MATLWILDVDNTITQRYGTELLPGVKEWINNLDPLKNEVCLATNQGGVGLRFWMELDEFGEPEKLPTEQEVRLRLERVRSSLIAGTSFDCPFFVSFRYFSKNGHWSPTPYSEDSAPPAWQIDSRKPRPGMICQAMNYFSYTNPADVVMVGNGESDEGAAKAAGVRYVNGSELFFFTTLP